MGNTRINMVLDTGHTAFILICMALVQLMLPGLAFFYAGLLQANSVITMIMQNFACMGVVSVLWFLCGFSLCFGSDQGFFGNITDFWGFKNVNGEPLMHDGVAFVDDIPGLAFAGYQGMFAVITPALMTGAFADRIRFGPYLFFISVWLIFIYCPFCHWITLVRLVWIQRRIGSGCRLQFSIRCYELRDCCVDITAGVGVYRVGTTWEAFSGRTVCRSYRRSGDNHSLRWVRTTVGCFRDWYLGSNLLLRMLRAGPSPWMG